MGMTHDQVRYLSALADVIGFIPKDSLQAARGGDRRFIAIMATARSAPMRA